MSDKKMSVGARGDATIQAGEREVRVLYTNRALAEAEAQLGRSVIALAQGMSEGQCGITETAHLLRAGMEAQRRDARESGRTVTLGDAYEVLDAAGFPAVIAAVMGAVAEVLGYSPNV